MMHPNRDNGNSVPPGKGDVEVVEIDNQSMPVEVPVDSATETEGERNVKEGTLEDQPIPMNVVVDSSNETEANTKSTILELGTDESKTLHKGKKRKGNTQVSLRVESLMVDLKMNDSECIDEDTSGPKPMKERKKTVDSIRGSPSWSKKTKDDCFQVGSSSRVMRSQRRKQLEEERSTKESGLQPPNMGAHNAAPKHASGSGARRRTGMKTDETINETKAKDDIPTMMDDGSSSLFQSSSASGEKTPNTTKKTGLVNECTDIVLSQQVDDPMKQLWDSPTYVQQVYESMHVSVENSKAMKFLRDIEPPGFDLGINPVKVVQQENASVAGASGMCGATDRGKGKLFGDEQASDEDVVNQGVTQSRISASVTNIVASYSCEQILEENTIKKFIAPKKEEHDSISDNEGDPLLRMRAVDEKTQYGIFRKNLEEAARHWPNLMKMKDIDLNLVKTSMKKEIERFTSMDPDIKLHILRQEYETRFERLEL
ncbi:hypothetical protein L6452_01350 [Arctium lappa]|uniref:Uncharacterized protein n=1 Tax=Arctium lappa TaxID=4217 RepID=A0ACB9FGJ2_ARCLA|nr:hypothetical protein L6452_01350 [Arctium lappa]